MDNIDNSVEYARFPEDNEFFTRRIIPGNPLCSPEPYQLYRTGVIAEICSQAFPCSMAFSVIASNDSPYLNKGKIRIELGNLVKLCAVDIFVGKIIKKVTEIPDVKLLCQKLGSFGPTPLR